MLVGFYESRIRHMGDKKKPGKASFFLAPKGNLKFIFAPLILEIKLNGLDPPFPFAPSLANKLDNSTRQV